MDDFKKYMLHHAGQMDFDEPGENVWKNIALKATKKQGSKLVMFVRFAAAACLILFAGFAVFLLNRRSAEVVKTEVKQPGVIAAPLQQPIKKIEQVAQQEEPLAAQTFEKPSAATSNVHKAITATTHHIAFNQPQHNASAFQNIENSFSQLVSIQLNKVRSLPLYAEGPEYYSEFKKQFQQLEEDEKELKKVIGKEGLINENLSQLINVYQQKLNLLKLLQNEIDKTNSRYRQNKPSDTTNAINYINL